jgi:glycosyltransferase involved in cell wall biosynthesis
MKFSVSVIIPVFNAALYIEKAINSALIQSEVVEIIVVNDGSTDKTQQVLDKLQKSIIKLKVVYHPNKINKGRSASRNRGIQQANGNYIAFLDADDYYLENRFSNDDKLFQDHNAIDGVYNAIGVHFYREAREEEKELELTTVTEEIKDTELFNYLLSGKKGYFSIDGLTLKKSIFNKVGYFNEELEAAEDTDLILKMAIKCKLYTGVIHKPLAIRGVHHENVFNQVNLYKTYQSKMYESLIHWGIHKKIPTNTVDKLLDWMWYYRNKEHNSLKTELLYWIHLINRNPSLLLSNLGYKYFPIIRQRKKFFPILFR